LQGSCFETAVAPRLCCNQTQDRIIWWDIGHRVAIMHILQHAGFIDEHQGRQSAQLEQFNLLPVEIEDGVFRVWQADKGQIFLEPILPERFRSLRANYDNFGM